MTCDAFEPGMAGLFFTVFVHLLLEDLAQHGRDLVDLPFFDNQRRQQADHVGSGGQRDDAMIEQLREFVLHLLFELYADHQAEPEQRADLRQVGHV